MSSTKCSHLDYFIKTYFDKIKSAALYTNQFYNGAKITDVPFSDITKFCFDLGCSFTIEFPEELNASCEQCSKYDIPKCTLVECLTHQNFVEFLELIAAYTIAVGASLNDININYGYRRYRISSTDNGMYLEHQDYINNLYHMIGPPKMPEEYEMVMIKPILLNRESCSDFEIRLNKPYRDTSKGIWPSSGYIFPFRAILSAGFTSHYIPKPTQYLLEPESCVDAGM